MKKIIIFIFVFILCVPPLTASAVEQKLSERLSGRILLQVESFGRAWYVNPVDSERYYLQDGDEAYAIMRTLGLGITNSDLEKIPQASGDKVDTALVSRVSGRILLQVEENGEAWYVNPTDGFRYYMKDGDAAYGLMRSFGLGITNQNLAEIAVNSTQVIQDTTFDDVAYVKVSNGVLVASKNADQILPPASMTKLMTALVFLDQGIVWSRRVTITPEHISYPVYYAGKDATSEVGFEPGDVVSVYDLWVAMLVASSNQSAIALADASGLTREGFVEAMNSKAKELGLAKTHFIEPSGLSAHTVTTPREMAIIAAEAFEKSDIANAGHKNNYTIRPRQDQDRSISVQDRNYSLWDFGADAAKTGYLEEAQRCVSLKKGDDIVVVMHARSMTERNDVLNLLLNE